MELKEIINDMETKANESTVGVGLTREWVKQLKQLSRETTTGGKCECCHNCKIYNSCGSDKPLDRAGCSAWQKP